MTTKQDLVKKMHELADVYEMDSMDITAASLIILILHTHDCPIMSEKMPKIFSYIGACIETVRADKLNK